jgi:hypothetical protein
MSIETNYTYASSPNSANRRIRAEIADSVHFHATHPEHIGDRLDYLEREWDIERTLLVNASSLILGGLALGTFVHRRFYALPAFVAGFLLQHGLQGWCPPLPIFRLLGVRTKEEILKERNALRALRGELDKAHAGDGEAPSKRAERILAALEEE